MSTSTTTSSAVISTSNSSSIMSNDSSAPTKDSSSFKSIIRNAQCEHLVAGFSGGVISTLVLHPLDLLKIRFAVNDGKLTRRPRYSGIKHAVSSILKQEGGFRGLYKGVTPNVAGAGTSWGLYFLFYNKLKTARQGGNAQRQLSPGNSMLCAAQSGALTLLLTNPIWVVKTRLCLQYDNSSAQYRGITDAFIKIGRTEGIKGLYKGFVPGLFGVTHGMVQFTVYEEFKSAYCNYYLKQPIDTKLGTSEYLCFSASSKLIAALSTYPYQVIRARLQDQNCQYRGVFDCVKQTFRNEGFGGFYKGLTPNLIRVVPATAITFVTYENIKAYLTSSD